MNFFGGCHFKMYMYLKNRLPFMWKWETIMILYWYLPVKEVIAEGFLKHNSGYKGDTGWQGVFTAYLFCLSGFWTTWIYHFLNTHTNFKIRKSIHRCLQNLLIFLCVGEVKNSQSENSHLPTNTNRMQLGTALWLRQGNVLPLEKDGRQKI